MTTVTSRILKTINDYRQRLLQREAQAVAFMEHYRTHAIMNYIQPKLNALYKQIEEKQTEILASRDDSDDKSPPKIPESWLYEAKRLEIIEKLISERIDDFGAMAEAQTLQLQRFGMNLGLESAQQQMRDVVPSAVKAVFGVPSTKALGNLVGATQAGSPLHDLFAGFGQEASQKAVQALVSGVTLGNNPLQIAKGVKDALDISKARARTISRTESLRAYRTASLMTFRENSDVVDKWRWTCDKSPVTCICCILMDGQEFDLSVEFGSHPNCRCSPCPVTKSFSSILSQLGIDGSDIPETRIAIQSGPDWFNDQPESVKQQILGAAKYAAFSNGDFQLEDIVGRSHSDDWGHSIYEKSLKDLVRK